MIDVHVDLELRASQEHGIPAESKISDLVYQSLAREDTNHTQLLLLDQERE
jgi:hypothetical protein